MIGGAQKKDRSQRRRSEQGPGPLAALALTRRRKPLFFSPVTRPWLLCGTPRLGASSVSGRTRALADPTRPGSPFGGRVDALLGHDGELFVRSLLLGEILPQHRGAVPASKLPRPRDQRAIACDLVMLHRLRGGNHGSIEHVLILHLAHDVVGLFEDAVDRRAAGALRLLAVHAKHLLQALHLLSRLAEMGLEALLEFTARGLVDHIR